MPKRSRLENREDESAPRPLSAYLLLGLIAVVVIAGAYFNRDAITAFVVNVINPSPSSTIVISEAGTFASPEPNCSSTCGRACWLVASGSVEGTFASAQGKIGVLGCDDNCWSVTDVVNNLRCCRNSDCPRGELCSNGVCAV